MALVEDTSNEGNKVQIQLPQGLEFINLTGLEQLGLYLLSACSTGYIAEAWGGIGYQRTFQINFLEELRKLVNGYKVKENLPMEGER